MVEPKPRSASSVPSGTKLPEYYADKLSDPSLGMSYAPLGSLVLQQSSREAYCFR